MARDRNLPKFSNADGSMRMTDPSGDPSPAGVKKAPQIITSTRRDAFTRRRSQLFNERTSWVQHWRDLGDYFLPRKGRWLVTVVNRGEKRNQKIIDSTPVFAGRTLSAGLMSGVTNPATPWFRLQTPDKKLNKMGVVQSWLSDTTDKMLDIFAGSNVYNVLPTIYGELGVFGTAAMYEMEDLKDVVRFYAATINGYMIAQNSRLMVDTIYRDYRYTVAQCVQFFGFENCSVRTQGLWRSGSTEQWIDVTHAIEPNNDRNPYMMDARNMPFRSVWYEWGGDSDSLNRISGFHEFPCMVPRWEPTAEDVYGSSPGMDVLGDAKSLQYQQKQKARAIDKHVDPPMVATTALKSARTSLLPGDVTYADMSNGTQGFIPAYVIQPDTAALLEDIKEMEGRINTGFYVDLFQMLSNDDRSGITAREIQERHEEKLLMLGPVLTRLNGELLDPMIERTFNIAMRRGLLPRPPPILSRAPINIEYVSILAQAQKLAVSSKIDSLFAFAGQVNQITQSTQGTDKIDIDASIEHYADALGTPPALMISDDKLKAIKDAKAKQQQQAQMAAMAEPAAKAAAATKSMATAPTTGDTALSRMLGQTPMPGANI